MVTYGNFLGGWGDVNGVNAGDDVRILYVLEYHVLTWRVAAMSDVRIACVLSDDALEEREDMGGCNLLPDEKKCV